MSIVWHKDGTFTFKCDIQNCEACETEREINMNAKPTTLREAAEKHIVHVSKTNYACPACGEETHWYAALDDFKAGAAFREAQILELLRSYEALEFACTGSLKTNQDWADWLEKRLKDGDK